MMAGTGCRVWATALCNLGRSTRLISDIFLYEIEFGINPATKDTS